MRNERLADAIRHSGHSVDNVSERLGVDPKTVHRWIADGRLPHARSRTKLASILGVPSAMLWPEAPSSSNGTAEVLGIYSTRAQISPTTVASMLAGAHNQIDVLGFSALWLWDAVQGFSEILRRKMSEGVRLRICLGDPNSDAVRLRGEEERVGQSFGSRCEIAIKYATSFGPGAEGVVRISGQTLYASMFRFDNDLLLNTHLFGNAAVDSPVLHLCRHEDRGIFENAMRSFDRVWTEAQPLAVG